MTPAERTDMKVHNHLYMKVSVGFKGDSSTLKKQAEFFTLHKIGFQCFVLLQPTKVTPAERTGVKAHNRLYIKSKRWA